MKNSVIVLLCCLCIKTSAQNSSENFDGKKWEAPYTLATPQGWDIERFLIPVAFAPAINYNGVEDIRFTPGWGKKETNDYWSYAFLWYLDGKPAFDSKIMEQNLVAYYTGLFNINIDKNKIDTSQLKPVTASIHKRITANGDTQTFEGTVNMNDFLTKMPIAINLIIHVRLCEGQNKTFVFYEVSPKPYEDAVWKGLDQLWTSFKCSK